MALILASAASLSPEIKLTQALADYEAILSDEDRTAFCAQKQPDHMDAIKLTIIIDSQCSARRRQCLGSRLITFLESVQNFSGIVDTFVSSKPHVAALVWGGVKLALLAANNFSAYFDHLSVLLMNLGKLSPRIQELGSVFPSLELQKAVYDYYAAIIRLCKFSTQLLQKPGYVHFSKGILTSFSADFGSYEREIANLCQEVRDLASLASKQAQKQENELQARERSEASKHRKIIIKLSDTFHQSNKEEKQLRLKITQRRLEKQKLKALNVLSTYDYQKAYRQIRKEVTPGTSRWILDTSEFNSWLEGKSKVFWCSGKIGSGKSVISACVAAETMISTSTQDVMSLFFCRFDDEESLQANTIIGSIARQLVSNLPADQFRGINMENLDWRSIVTFLESHLSKTQRHFIVIDGLDECNETQLKGATEFLYSLLDLSIPCIQIFWSSRPNVSIWLPRKLQPNQRISLDSIESQARIASDICRFIKATLIEWLDGDIPELRISDPTLALKIAEHLETEAHGMFLWAKLQLYTLRGKRSDEQIRTALKHLPRDLPETFNRILSTFTEPEDITIGKAIFNWTAVAKRPLKTDELREAIGTEPFQKALNSGRFINDLGRAIACCGNLVFVDEEQQTLHFTHSSVKRYLCDITISPSPYYIDLEKADTEAGVICMTYLNFANFTTQMARTTQINIDTADVPSTVVRNSLTSAKYGNRLALSLLRRRDHSRKSYGRLLIEAMGITEGFRQQVMQKQFTLLPYARKYWLEHTKNISPSSQRRWALWCKMVKDGHMQECFSGPSWKSEDWTNPSVNVFEWIVDSNHCALAQLIMQTTTLLSDEKIGMLVIGAAARGLLRLLEISLHSRRIHQPILDFSIKMAAKQGHLAVLERLLQGNSEIKNPTNQMQKIVAIKEAATRGHLAIVDRLLNETVVLNALNFISDDVYSLEAAVGEKHRSAIEQRLQKMAGTTRVSDKIESGTALQLAAQGGHLTTVERLLDANADVKPMANVSHGRTALQAAAQGGHLAIVERLLQSNADANGSPCDFDLITALQAAAQGGHLAIVERLVQSNADVNGSPGDSGGRTALQAAAQGGHLAIVERLLEANADINGPPSRVFGRTAIQAAAEGGHLAIVEKILQRKLNVDAGLHGEFQTGWTALHFAAFGGHLAVVDRLLEKGASVSAMTASDWSALYKATGSNYDAIRERLRRAQSM